MKKTDWIYFVREVQGIIRHYKITKSPEFEEKRMRFFIIKGMHSLEKGLSLEKPRVGFGKKKVQDLLQKLEKYVDAGFDCNDIAIQMAIGALRQYLNWHIEKDALDPEIATGIEHIQRKIAVTYNVGGTVYLTRREIQDFNSDDVSKAIYTRHSVRHFSKEKVDNLSIMEAIKEAEQCPSACNRQPTRVHLFSSEEEKKYLSEHLEGVGGFAENCSAFIIITGSVSAFSFTENNQWLVNAGIFVGYLVLTLHTRGIGSCVIQRPLIRSTELNELRNHFNIPEDEEIVCAIGLGKYPDSFYAPVSARRPVDEIITEH